MTTDEDLSEGTVPLEFLHELASDLALQHIVEKTSEQSAVVVEALKRDFLRYVVRGVRHCLTNSPSEREIIVCASVCVKNQKKRSLSLRERESEEECVCVYVRIVRECGARVLCSEGN